MRVRRPSGATSDHDAGMTLVEVMVAMLILTVVLSALASVLTTSLHSLHGNESRVRANALANEVLEDLQERRWRFVGFAGDDFDDPDVDQPADTVIVDDDLAGYADWKADAGRVLPLETYTRDGVEYTVETKILWEDDASTATDEDYKRFDVEVRWDEFTRERTTSHSAQRTPSSHEQDAGLTIRSITVNPSWATLEQAPVDETDGRRKVSEDIEVIVRLSGVYDSVELAIEKPNGDSQTQTLFNVGPHEYSTHLFDLETYHGETTFTVTAQDDDGVVVTKSAVAQYVYPVVEIEDPPRVADGVCADPDNDYRLTGDLDVAVDVTGLLVYDTVTVITHGGDGEAFDAAYEGDAVTWADAEHIGSEFVATLPEGLATPPGDDDRPRLEVEALREFDGAAHSVVGHIDLCEET